MNYSTVVKNSKYFLKQLKRLGKKYSSLKQDVSELRSQLIKQPRTGEDLGQGAFKIRLKITSKGKGKSGGARVISYVETEVIGMLQNNMVVLLSIYDKGEMDSLSKDEIARLIENMELE